jgi:hypothetical protein
MVIMSTLRGVLGVAGGATGSSLATGGVAETAGAAALGTTRADAEALGAGDAGSVLQDRPTRATQDHAEIRGN